jgi:hypothetical protein
MLGGIEEVSWIRKGLPEYLWLALAHDSLGDHSAVEAVSSLARLCRKLQGDLEYHTFAATSSYLRVPAQDTARARETLAAGGVLFQLQNSLRPLVALYPSCPIAWLFSNLPDPDLPSSLEHIRGIVSKLYDRSDLLCTRVQATVVYLAFDAGVLKVQEGLSLAQFPKIEEYPHTDISKRVAGAIRSTINMFLASNEFVPDSAWPSYFWNRSYTLTPCELPSDE